MNFLFIFESELQDVASALIEGERARQITIQHELVAHQPVKVAIQNRGMADGTIVTLTPTSIGVRFDKVHAAPDPLPLHALIAVSRPQTIKKVLQFAATIGIPEISLIGSERGQASYLQSKGLLPDAITQELIKGLEQGGDCVLPKVNIYRSVKLFFKQAQLRHLDTGVLNLIAATTTSSPQLSSELVTKNHSKVRIAIGPESGWSETEEKIFAENDFHPIRLGSRILRVEQAFSVMVGELRPLLSKIPTIQT